MSYEKSKTATAATSTDSEVRPRGFDLLQIMQTGHIIHIDVKENKNKSANVIIGVRSSVGIRYDKDAEDNNEVTIFWSRYYKEPEAAVKFADNLTEGKYVTVLGTRQDYNKKDADGKWERLYENYLISDIKWGFDFAPKTSE